MSRYKISTYQPQKYEAYVGFDLAGHTSYWTFFGQVINLEIQNQLENLDFTQPHNSRTEEELEEEQIVLWAGDDYHNPVRRLDELKKLMAPYCSIPEEILQQLRDDQERELQQPKFQSSDWIESFFGEQGQTL